jgi:hypothetical protein
MKTIEKTFKTMETDCISYGNANNTVWSSNGIIKALFNSLTDNNTQLDSAIELQKQSDPTGMTTNKNKKIEALINRTYIMGRKLTLYAKQSKNTILLNDVDINESSMIHFDDDKLILACNLIVKRGRENLTATASYGVTSVELDGIAADVAAIKALPSTITVVTSDHKSATKAITRIITQARIILDQLDDAIEGMITNQTFIEGWFDARKIKGRHHPKTTPTPPTAPKA